MTTMPTITRMGHTFRPMTAPDYEGLAGADVGTFICDSGEHLLLLSPCGTQITEIRMDREITWRRA